MGEVTVAELDWGNEEHIKAVSPPFDLVVAADVVRSPPFTSASIMSGSLRGRDQQYRACCLPCDMTQQRDALQRQPSFYTDHPSFGKSCAAPSFRQNFALFNDGTFSLLRTCLLFFGVCIVYSWVRRLLVQDVLFFLSSIPFCALITR